MRGGNGSYAWSLQARGLLPLRTPNVSLGLLLLGVCVVSAAGEPKKPEVATCESCHQAQASMQPETQMGRAMELPGGNTVLDTHPKLTFRIGQYSYAVETRDGKSRYTVTDGARTITLPILWSMGAQAQTWVVEREGTLYESLVSYYPAINALDVTTGDERVTPKTLEEAVGRPQTADGAKACFGCHATNAVVDHKLNLTTLQAGVTCEHCHLGASAHMADIVQGDMGSVPRKLGKMSSEDMSNFCGQCHRSWETVVRNHWHGEPDVRFQPYRLANSKCFDGADPRISCIACHDPHQKVVREASFYDSKCLACHAPPLTAGATNAAHGKVCPVAKSNCIQCHMPRVALPNGHLQFADHEIRVVKPGEAFPN